MIGYSGIALAVDPPPAYIQHCASCHAVDGRGRASTAIGKIPDLRSKAIASLSDEKLFDAIARGDTHKAYAHSFLNLGVSESELRGIEKYVRAIQGVPSHAEPSTLNPPRWLARRRYTRRKKDE
jgi:mono/diheme cytochrome c family protein